MAAGGYSTQPAPAIGAQASKSYTELHQVHTEFHGGASVQLCVHFV